MFKEIKKACQLTDLVFQKTIQNFSQFKTERDIYNFIYHEIKKLHLKPSFPVLVISGHHYQKIHRRPQKTKLHGFTIIDLGIKYKNYCSDFTRMVFVGQPKKSDLQLYALLLKTQLQAIKKIKLGKKYASLDLYARKLLGQKKKYFIHTLGHGVGKKIHQPPKISPKSEDLIKRGDLITIEPGLYYKNKFGLRIEDTLYIGKKPLPLTKSPKKLLIFPKSL